MRQLTPRVSRAGTAVTRSNSIRWVVVLLTCAFALASVAQPQSASLTLGSGTQYAGLTVPLDLTLSGGPVAGLQWTLMYPQADFTSVQFTLGPSAVNAGKSVQCHPGLGSVTCVLVGLNDNDISPGPVAVANLTLAGSTPSSPPSRTVSLTIGSPLGATCDAEATTVVPSAGSVTILKPAPTQVLPTSVSLFAQQTQQFSADATVSWSISPSVGSITQTGLYTAPAIISTSQQVTITATNTTNSDFRATATVNLHPVTVSVSPASASLSASQTRQFTATVTDAPNSAVNWSISPVGSGSISPGGSYTAPGSIPSAQAVTVRATSVYDPSKSATAVVNLVPDSGGGGGVYITLEAEAGSLTSPMSIGSDPQASQGQYVSSSAYASGAASLNFSVPAPGVYLIWCRVLSPANNQDSFFVSVDGGPEDVYDTAQGTWSSDWQWTVVNGRAGTSTPLTLNPRTFSLSAGSHSVVFRDREYDTKLDQIIVTNDLGFVPNQAGGPKIGIFRAGLWLLDVNGNGLWDGAPTDRALSLGQTGDEPITGDWNADGIMKIGFFRNGLWLLDYNGNGQWDGSTIDRLYSLGQAGDVPVVGDWNGNGKPQIGFFRPATGMWLLDYNGNGQWDGPTIDRLGSLGQAGDVPVVGDWNGDGKTEVGFFRPATGMWLLDYNGNNGWDGPGVDRLGSLGQAGDVPVVEDWDGDGKTEVGFFRPATGMWLLDYNGNGGWDGPSVDRLYSLGQAGDVPVVGDWNGDGRPKIGFFRSANGMWLLDHNGNGGWDGTALDRLGTLGQGGDSPVVGNW